MSLQARLLLAAIGVIAVSLAISGTLTAVLIRNLEVNQAQVELERSALLVKPQAANAECRIRNATTNRCDLPTRTEAQYLTQLNMRLSEVNLQDDRLLVLGAGASPRVLYDSEGQLPQDSSLSASAVPLGNPRSTSGGWIADGAGRLGSVTYYYAATPVGGRIAKWVVVGRRSDAVAAHATAQMIPRILAAGLAALLLAVAVSVILSRALTRPLQDLRRATEDIAAGNYARRVSERGPPETRAVTRAFNRMAEAVEQARSQQRAFLADASHELKTPLTSLIGFSQALVDGSLLTEEERRRAATIVNEEAQRVLRLSQELLDLARVEAGQITFDPQNVDLGAQLQQEVEMLRPRAEARRLVFRLEVPEALPPVRADPERLHQILDNLVDNAVKYAPAGSGVMIVAEVHPGWVVTEVRNPVGTHRPDPERMFDRFYRADPSRSAAGGGVGLGLSISRELAAAQGGLLQAYLGPEGWLHMRLVMPADLTPQPPGATATPAGRLLPLPEPRG
ncbi:MAG: HAMP domain-containing histidine kinase [Candidatus Dormibacteraeota bacterium]|nr:HAMP domain-containing histidine kinase [Candidatus Dormibacteraeota bacterium]MBO0762009.1 HAMP domain-containing histidine kinase [Candidatus Dormibacteraeota bacterium]